MAVSFNPRSTPVQGASIHALPSVNHSPRGFASAPSSIESQASDTGGCCGWIGKICEWIRSLFSSAPSLLSFEERVAKGKELIDRAFSFPPQCNPDRTVMVCELRYNDQVEVVFGKVSTEAPRFKEGCYRRLSNLLVSNELIADGKLTVKSYFCERLGDRLIFRTTEKMEIADFKAMPNHAATASSGQTVGLSSVINDVRQIYRPNDSDGAPLVSFIAGL